MLTKWWKLELTLATNFGSHAQMVTKFGGQILATKFGFVPDCSLVDQHGHENYHWWACHPSLIDQNGHVESLIGGPNEHANSHWWACHLSLMDHNGHANKLKTAYEPKMNISRSLKPYLTHTTLYSVQMRSMPWLLMSWLLLSSGHQELWHWLQDKQMLVFHKEGFCYGLNDFRSDTRRQTMPYIGNTLVIAQRWVVKVAN